MEENIGSALSRIRFMQIRVETYTGSNIWLIYVY